MTQTNPGVAQHVEEHHEIHRAKADDPEFLQLRWLCNMVETELSIMNEQYRELQLIQRGTNASPSTLEALNSRQRHFEQFREYVNFAISQAEAMQNGGLA